MISISTNHKPSVFELAIWWLLQKIPFLRSDNEKCLFGAMKRKNCIGSLIKQHIVNLKMIFVKKHEHRIMYMQFISDPLPTDLAGICLFHQRWTERFQISLLVHCPYKVVQYFFRYGGSILNQPFGGCFIKLSVFCARKMENGFSMRRKGKLPPATLFTIP